MFGGMGVGMDRSTVRSAFEAVVRYWWLAALVLIAVLAADVYYTSTRHPTYLARASLLISPSSVAVDTGQLVYSLDTLGRGRIFGTYTEVLGSEVVHREALESLRLSKEDLGRSIVIKSAGLADTAVIQVSVESPSPELSAIAANVVGEIGIARLQQLYPLYNLTFLNMATPPTRPYTPDPVRNYGLGLLFGLVLAVLVPWLVDTVARQRARQKVDQTTADPRPTVQDGTGARQAAGRPARGQAGAPTGVRVQPELLG
jgi:capsular polysaccharide biosynthesis protein